MLCDKRTIKSQPQVVNQMTDQQAREMLDFLGSREHAVHNDFAQGCDAANRSMRDRGLDKWDEECVAKLCKTFNKLWPSPTTI